MLQKLMLRRANVTSQTPWKGVEAAVAPLPSVYLFVCVFACVSAVAKKDRKAEKKVATWGRGDWADLARPPNVNVIYKLINYYLRVNLLISLSWVGITFKRYKYQTNFHKRNYYRWYSI